MRAGGLAHLKWAIDCLEAAGGEVLCGPFYQPLGIFSGDPPTAEERSGIVEVHKAAAKPRGQGRHQAGGRAAQPLRVLCAQHRRRRRRDRPAGQRAELRLLYDTFHTNIEEKDPVGVIAPNLEHIIHVHTSENDRGTPGKGHVPWAETFKALKEGGYDGWYVIEAFGRALPGIAEATRVWRDFFPHTDEVYQFGHDFLRSEWAQA